MTDHYETLGVPRDADDATIKKAYRCRARETHPDYGGDNDEAAKVNGAYLVLSDPARREQYDRTGKDDARPDPMARAVQVAARTFEQAITASGQRFEQTRLIADADMLLERERQAGEEANRSLQAVIARTRKILRRLKFNGNGQDFLTRQLDVIAKARVILADYAYEADAPPEPQCPVSNTVRGWTLDRGVNTFWLSGRREKTT